MVHRRRLVQRWHALEATRRDEGSGWTSTKNARAARRPDLESASPWIDREAGAIPGLAGAVAAGVLVTLALVLVLALATIRSSGV